MTQVSTGVKTVKGIPFLVGTPSGILAQIDQSQGRLREPSAEETMRMIGNYLFESKKEATFSTEESPGHILQDGAFVSFTRARFPLRGGTEVFDKNREFYVPNGFRVGDQGRDRLYNNPFVAAVFRDSSNDLDRMSRSYRHNAFLSFIKDSFRSDTREYFVALRSYWGGLGGGLVVDFLPVDSMEQTHAFLLRNTKS